MKKNVSKPSFTGSLLSQPVHSSPRGPAEHEVRQQIINAAGIYFRTFGYEKTTVSELAQHIDFSKAYIYKFFSSKKDIGEAIASSCIQTIIDLVLAEISGIARPDDKFMQLITSVNFSIKQLFFEEKKLYDIVTFAVRDHWQCHQQLQGFIQNTIKDIITEGQENGCFERQPSTDFFCRTIYLSLQSFLNPVMLAYTQDEDPKDVVELILLAIKTKAQ